MDNPLQKVDWQAYWEELTTLDTGNIGGWSTGIYGLFTVVVFVLLVGGLIYTQVLPIQDQIEREKRNETQLRRSFEEKQQKVANLDAYREQLAEMQKSFGSLLRQLPSETEVASLLNDISQTRVASGLEEELFKPEPDTPKEFYAELPNRIEVVGEFHDIAMFVSRVSALPRIVTVHDVKIKEHSQKPDLLHMTAVAKTYRYIEEEDKQ